MYALWHIYPYEPNIIIYLYKFFLIVHGIKTTFSSEPQLSVYNVKYSGRPMRICEPVQLCIQYCIQTACNGLIGKGTASRPCSQSSEKKNMHVWFCKESLESRESVFCPWLFQLESSGVSVFFFL